jgi:hypothetical protein
MQLELSDNRQRFVGEVQEFLDRHWDGKGADLFLRELCARGWSVPSWPVAQGGTGWPPDLRYLFDRTLASAGAPGPDPFTVDLVGGLLLSCGSLIQRQRHLPAIRNRPVRWCAHGSLTGSAPLEARWHNGRLALSPEVLEISSALGAAAVLGVGRLPDGKRVLVALPLEDCTIRAGDPLLPDEVDIAGAVPEAVGSPASGPEMLQVIARRVLDLRTSGAARLAARLSGLAALCDGLMAADRPDRLLHELGVELAALDALEQRVMLEPGPAPGLQLALRIRLAEARRRLGTVTVDALGYYALPDPLPGDNEGPLGPGSGRDAIGQLLGYVEGLDGLFDEVSDRDWIAALEQAEGAEMGS